MNLSATGAGMILGTAGYMSPEQARGKSVDRRADNWAFGVVVFEMLSGRSVFESETVTDTLVRVLEREPEWQQLPRETPATLRKLLQRCLTKNARDRLQAIGDARTTLQELISEPAAQETKPEAVAYPLWKKLLPWAVAPIFLAAGLLLRQPAAPTDRAVSQFEYVLPNARILLHAYRHAVELSPDGKRIAFVAATSGDANSRQIFVKNMDQWDPIPIPGTELAHNITFSPDGQWLGFQQGRQIKKVPLAGGTPTLLLANVGPNPDPGFGPPGISWGKNGTIVFANELGSGLIAIPDSGGEPAQLTQLDAEANEVSHRLPHFLPDGSAVLFTVLRYTTIAPDWERAQVWAWSLKSGERKLLIENALDARYTGNGSLIFARQGKLFAVRFDPNTLTVAGTPVPVVEGVTQALYGSAAITWTGAAQYDVSDNGTLIYAPGGIEPPLLSSLVWVDRTGNVSPLTGMKPMSRFAARISPDGKRVAFSELHVNKDIWVFDTVRETEDRTTYEGQNAFPIWAPDGSRMAFRSDRSAPLRIYLRNEQNSRDVVALTPGPLDIPSSWTADGKELAFTRGYSYTGGNTDIFVISVDQPNNARPVVNTNADERFPEFSPDGKWLAYTSNETGQFELYVQPYPGPGKRVTITSDGAVEPAWSKNSSELFYRRGQRMMSVRFKVSGTEFVPEKPVQLFQQPSLGGGTTVRATYDVGPDGRFLFNQPIPEPAGERNRIVFPSTLRVVLNWSQEVQRLLAERK
jgi:serine/threonine-protein kinase